MISNDLPCSPVLFRSGEPDGGINENCGGMFKWHAGAWADGPCDASLGEGLWSGAGYLCGLPLPPSPPPVASPPPCVALPSPWRTAPPGAPSPLAGPIIADRTLVPSTAYALVGIVVVAAPATLSILPGTTIYAEGEQSGLVIARGAKLVAQGTLALPITFTHPGGLSDPSVGAAGHGKWGGLVILGAAPTSAATPKSVEGLGRPDLTYGGACARTFHDLPRAFHSPSTEFSWPSTALHSPST